MADRFWGADKDRIAAKQLNLTEDYTIFMMANRGEFIPDEDYEGVELMLEGELWRADEVIAAIKEKEQPIVLPENYQLVGMCPLGKTEPKVYGIVDLSELDTNQEGTEQIVDSAHESKLELAGYQRKGTANDWIHVQKEDVEHYKNKGQEIRELYFIK